MWCSGYWANESGAGRGVNALFSTSLKPSQSLRGRGFSGLAHLGQRGLEGNALKPSLRIRQTLVQDFHSSVAVHTHRHPHGFDLVGNVTSVEQARLDLGDFRPATLVSVERVVLHDIAQHQFLSRLDFHTEGGDVVTSDGGSLGQDTLLAATLETARAVSRAEGVTARAATARAGGGL